MKKRAATMLVFISLLGFLLGGCAAVSSPVFGTIYTGVQAPVAVGDSGSSAKVGESSATSILGIFAVGDASIDAAKKAGGITKVAYVDHKSTSFLGIFAKWTTVVHGE